MDVSALIGLFTSGAGLLHGKIRKRGAGDAWKTAAETYGLLHKPSSFWSGPKLSGSLAGDQLTVDVQNRNTASAATRFRLDIPSLNLGLKLRKKGLWNTMRPRALVGDRAFDNQVVVNSRDWFAAREFLTPERRSVLQNFLTSFKGAVVTDDRISLTTRGYVKDSAEMLGAIDAMMRVASALSDESPASSVGQSESTPAAAITPADTVQAVAPEPVPEPAPAPAPEPVPAPESVPEPALAPEPEAAEIANAQTDSLASQDNAPGVEEFCATVFPPGALSITANQKFKESFVGKRIGWTGTLESATPYSFDFDFGAGHGIKAVLTILETEGAASRNVQAVIGLPPGIEGLDDRIGQPVAFAGTLLKVDGLAKRVLVADAEIR